MELRRELKQGLKRDPRWKHFRFHGPRAGESGFTLIEMMIAMVILAFGLMGVTAMMLTSIRGNAFGAKMTLATTLVQDKIEELRIVPWDDVYAGCNTAGFPEVCASPPTNMAVDKKGDILVEPNDDGLDGDELLKHPTVDKASSGDGIWTYKYVNAADPLPFGMTLVWGVLRNFPQPKLVWIISRVEWVENGQVRRVQMESMRGNF